MTPTELAKLRDYCEQFDVSSIVRDNGHVTLMSSNRAVRVEYYPSSKRKALYLPLKKETRINVPLEVAVQIAAGVMD